MPDPKSIRILVATPYRGLPDLIRPVARELGFGVSEAVDTESALAKIREEPEIGLILTDWSVEPRGGLFLAERVRANEKLKCVRLLFMSTTVTAEMVAAAKRVGAHGFLRKPFSLSTLQRKLVAVLAEPGEARDMLAHASACAWDGCAGTYDGPKLPQGWRHLLMYGAADALLGAAASGDDWDRVALLCPTHAKALDEMMKPVMRWANAPGLRPADGFTVVKQAGSAPSGGARDDRTVARTASATAPLET